MYLLGCGCKNITVIVKNNASLYQSSHEGSYKVSEIINGEATWVLYSKAIWYSHPMWVIGDVSGIGSPAGEIFSSGKNGRFSCPYEATNVIEIFSSNTNTILDGTLHDITIQCITPLQGDKNKEFFK